MELFSEEDFAILAKLKHELMQEDDELETLLDKKRGERFFEFDLKVGK